MAHKKGQGSTTNGRDSIGKRLGRQAVRGPDGDGRQHSGTASAAPHSNPGVNVGLGSDYTLFAKIDGVVAFTYQGKKNRRIHVQTAS